MVINRLLRVCDYKNLATTLTKAIAYESQNKTIDHIDLVMSLYTGSTVIDTYSRTGIIKTIDDYVNDTAYNTFCGYPIRYNDSMGKDVICINIYYDTNTKEDIMSNEQVKNPSHYCDGRVYEPKDVIRDWGLNFNLGSAVKYISRAGRKDPILTDLNKAKEFIQFEIDAIEAEEKKKKERNENDALWS